MNFYVMITIYAIRKLLPMLSVTEKYNHNQRFITLHITSGIKYRYFRGYIAAF